MFGDMSFQFYTVYTEYDKYCRDERKSGHNPGSFFKFIIGSM